jgi:hypothetical protein
MEIILHLSDFENKKIDFLKGNHKFTKLTIHNERLNPKRLGYLVHVLEFNDAIHILRFPECFISCYDIQILAPLFLNNRVTKLNLCMTDIGNEGLKYLVNILKDCSSLRKLNLGLCSISDDEIVSKLLKSNSNLKVLDLKANNFNSKDLLCLTNFLKFNSTLASLSLTENNIGDSDMEYLADMLETNISLKTLKLAMNMMISSKGLNLLTNALKTNNSLTELDLGCNDISEVNFLEELLQNNKSLAKINLNHNNLVNNEIQKLSQLLEKNSSINSIHLASNCFGDDGAYFLAGMLKNNNYLTYINFEDNHDITEKSIKYFEEIFEINTNLTHLTFWNYNISDEETELIDTRLKINRINKKRLQCLQVLCLEKMDRLNMTDEIKTFIPTIYESCLSKKVVTF